MKTTQMSVLLKRTLSTENISQRELAQSLGWKTPQSISNIIQGRGRLPVNKFKKLSRVSGHPLTEIVNAYVKDYKEDLLLKLGE